MPSRGRLNNRRSVTGVGCDVTLVPMRHPVVDIVRLPAPHADLAEARGTDPDGYRPPTNPRWQAARDAYT